MLIGKLYRFYPVTPQWWLKTYIDDMLLKESKVKLFTDDIILCLEKPRFINSNSLIVKILVKEAEILYCLYNKNDWKILS